MWDVILCRRCVETYVDVDFVRQRILEHYPGSKVRISLINNYYTT